jgi:hypothetical protein
MHKHERPFPHEHARVLDNAERQMEASEPVGPVSDLVVAASP